MEGSKKRLDVLLVEDDELVAQSMVRALRSRHNVRLATGVYEALDEIESRPPDVLISDFHLPPYLGGQLLAVVGRDYPRVARIAYSGQADGDLRHLVQIGLADCVVDKIRAGDELLRAVDEVVAKRQRPSSQ